VFFYSLLTIAVALVVVGVLETSAVGLEPVRNPYSTGRDLFDATQFILQRRARRAPVGDPIAPSSSSSSLSSSASSSLSSSSSSGSLHSAAEVAPITMQDLTSAQRETLRLQLRMNVCPQTADAAYLALCRLLLKDQDLRIPQAGLKNPHQK
jgi:hypothetical protein